MHDATTRYLQTVDAVSDEALAEPSVLPGWSRAHVVAHVALNARGMTRALLGAAHRQPAPIYDSEAARDADIEANARLAPGALRDLSLDACGRLREAFGLLGRLQPGATVDRLPGGPTFPATGLVTMRWREVEIHHADLDLDYGPHDWPEAFLDAIFNTVVHDRQEDAPMLLRTPDGDVPIGDGSGPTITGTRPDLAWWLLGRGRGEHLSVDGELPTLGPWKRRTRAR